MDRDEKNADEIRDAMARVRRDVGENAGQVISHARELTDWRYYVRKYPATTLAAAAAIGYLLVPARAKTRTLTGRDGLKAESTDDRLAASSVSGSSAANPLWEKALTIAAQALITKGIPLMTREVARWWQVAPPKVSQGARPIDITRENGVH